jgi:CRP/FNR family transcriptional regulator, cyclic AMP receptor protein
MPCEPQELRHVPLFSLLDDDELAVLAQQVELRDFAAMQRIYKAGDPSSSAFVVLSGTVGDFFGFASMLESTPHQTTALAIEPTTCLQIDRNDIEALLSKKPLAGLDMLTVLSREIHSAQSVIRTRAMRNPNELIDEQETFGERVADKVASFGGSWTFIILFGVVLVVYTFINHALLKDQGWDPYPFILLNLFLSMLAALQAPVIMMSQNRQDTKDRVRSELDFEVNRRAEAEIQSLSHRLSQLSDRIGDIDDRLRDPNAARHPHK